MQPTNQQEPKIVTIRHKVLRAMLKAAARIAYKRVDKKDEPKVIENILIRSTNESLKVVATDGHRLIILDGLQQEYDEFEALIDPEHYLKFIQAGWSGGTCAKLTFRYRPRFQDFLPAKVLEISWFGGSVLLKHHSEKFPSFMRVIPQPYGNAEVSTPAAVYGKYLADIGAIARDIAARGAIIDQRGNLDSIRVEFEGDASSVKELKDKRNRLCDCLMVQMPYRYW